jgi:rifampicin phosphotransferase
VGCIYSLGDQRSEPALLGGKGASLVKLARAGFPVPAGFVIDASGYQCWRDHAALGSAIAGLLATPDLRLPKIAREACAPLNAALSVTTLPADLQSEILAAYAGLRQRGGAAAVVAVRSSALSEDGAGASSAGLYETFLNLRGADAVLDAVRRCYCSLWAARAVQYRAYKGIDSSAEAMAVVVLEMAPADVSGVAFTANPLTGSRDEIVINASWGLGEAIVSGRVTPDNYVLRKADLAVIGRDVYAKELMILPDPAGGIVSAAVTGERAMAATLGDEQLSELGRLCLAIEACYGVPQDIEWAYGGGRWSVLQSRPITGLR